MALKPEAGSFFHKVADAAKKFFLIKIKGFEVDKMVLMTVMMEGDSTQVQQQSASLVQICADHGGLNAGAEAGYRGYFLTYMIAYLRDFGMQCVARFRLCFCVTIAAGIS
jgi:alkyldihydroxyacetonephosphate synthase